MTIEEFKSLPNDEQGMTLAAFVLVMMGDKEKAKAKAKHMKNCKYCALLMEALFLDLLPDMDVEKLNEAYNKTLAQKQNNDKVLVN